MKLFHGSTTVVSAPDVTKSRPYLNFGQGFYLTSHREQAENWARRKAYLEDGAAYVNEYEVVEDFGERKVLRFPEANSEWVEFVCSCRRGEDVWREFDLIIGGVANDRAYYAVDMYYQGAWSMEQTLDVWYRSNLSTSVERNEHGLQYLDANYLVDELLKQQA